ncbi:MULTISPECIES: VOC family protein [Legionella]|uniref:VOC family protein n=1 Tax=Legionella septentrionalis TaxID=2498109 RepID=A0A433JH70_9GAMM|nr:MULTISPECIES: VOC family protein [Legionella]MCP0914679.1 VOC family protein [Legionella sp. 27cVA30]RUQ81605.1 VOC family protein [Legionella septentrionalis]RUQ95749.1 VOC family protein [Legionella septentrionalis]RUR09137.1 VOC family protein [Legionella septentrionalis]
MMKREGEMGWNRLLTVDTEAAADFYMQLFNWERRVVKVNNIDYTIFELDGKKVAGMLKILPRQMSTIPPNWLSFIVTESLNVTLEKAKALGAAVVIEPVYIDELGLVAVIIDPSGAYVGLIEP